VRDESHHEAEAPAIVIVTGLSGAGRSTAAKALEDMGWFVVENLPPALLPTMVELAARSAGAVSKVAAVVDVRSRAFTTDLHAASDETLMRRFDSVRRPHPLQGDGGVSEGIVAERELLRGVRGEADLVLDTSALNVHELRARMQDFFDGEGVAGLRVTVVSFGYKYGMPVDADMVTDCRFLPNPHWIEELAPLTGQDPPVRDYVLGQPGAKKFLDAFLGAMQAALPGFEREGKRFVTLAVGCTGGKHRSVAMAEQIAARLGETGATVQVVHRDLGRE
jgi:UPF0042 nucleotide-binding protein